MAVDIFKYLLSDHESLVHYQQNKNVNFDDIRRRLFLNHRNQDYYIPDHILRISHHQAFTDIKNLKDIFLKGVLQLATENLEIKEKIIYIKPKRENIWQEIITFLPPLFLQALLLYQEYENKDPKMSAEKFYELYIFPNTKFTSIPSTGNTDLQKFLNTKGGLHDLHMHLNGSIETDQVWQDYLSNPIALYKDLKESYKLPKVKEQLEQESTLFEPLSFVRLLHDAQKIRMLFYIYIYDEKNLYKFNFSSTSTTTNGGSKHPFLKKIDRERNYPHLMSVETYMFVLVLEKLNIKENKYILSKLHYYLLILGLTNRLLVQQTHQNGFEQFQKNTLNGMRENSEKTFKRRFLQMNGNNLKNLNFLEGRFSPKGNLAELKVQIDNIYSGWKHMKDILNNETTKKNVELKLVAHFIKKADTKPHSQIRHKSLRTEIIRKAKNLVALSKIDETCRDKVRGVDAASSELDTPPEVFALTYRFLRNNGFTHFTYHAGEDFYHIIDGLRAIYEAIEFCDLKKNDRIGHAVATGIDAELWLNVVGTKIQISRGLHLDNLTFVYHLLSTLNKTGIKKYHTLCGEIENEIIRLSNDIYDNKYSIDDVVDAWLLRKFCPLHMFNDDLNLLKLSGAYDKNEIKFLSDINYHNIKDKKHVKLYKKYHEKSFLATFNEIIEIDTVGLVDIETIKELQLLLLKFMAKKEIVIETLPTSNIRIGFHKNFSTYHIKNWIKFKEDKYLIPEIVVGSDDTGIFATNIFNEYANIYCSLLDEGKTPGEVISVLNKLNKNSLKFKFS